MWNGKRAKTNVPANAEKTRRELGATQEVCAIHYGADQTQRRETFAANANDAKCKSFPHSTQPKIFLKVFWDFPQIFPKFLLKFSSSKNFFKIFTEFLRIILKRFLSIDSKFGYSFPIPSQNVYKGSVKLKKKNYTFLEFPKLIKFINFFFKIIFKSYTNICSDHSWLKLSHQSPPPQKKNLQEVSIEFFAKFFQNYFTNLLSL